MVTLETSGEPVSAALVELLADSALVVVARTLTGPDGLFRLSARSPGAYRLRIARIGLASPVSDPFRLTTEDVVFREIAVGTEPVSLDAIAVQGQSRCTLQRDAPVSVQRLWDEARKTLYSIALLEDTWHASFRLLLWERDLDPESGNVRSETLAERTLMQVEPFASKPARELLRGGFIQRDGDSTTYYVPDAKVLLSDEFLDAYCFRAVTDGHERVGLEFEPVAGGTGVRGTLWLDRRTAALHQVEYEYTNTPTGQRDLRPGGAVFFDMLENGAWIVSRWFVRMPRFAIVNGHETGRVALLRETGGQVQAARLTGRERGFALNSTTVSGTLGDVNGQPIAGAVVYVPGTARGDTTDHDGAFSLSDLLPGRYTLSWMRTGDDTGERVAVTDLEVTGADTVVVLRELDHLAHLNAVCPPERRASGTGVVIGRVIAEDSLPAAFAPVKLSDPTGRITHSSADAAGRFAFCDVRTEARIEATSGSSSAIRYVALDANEIMRILLRVPARIGQLAVDTVMSDRLMSRLASTSTAEASQNAIVEELLHRVAASDTRPARILGKVIDAASGAPVAGALVQDIGAGTEIVTDSRGTFRFEARDPIVALDVSHVGFESVSDTIRVRAGEMLHVDVQLGVLTLAPITVAARRRGLLADAYWRAANHIGGAFIDAEAIRRRSAMTVTDVLREQPSIHVLAQGSGFSGGRLYFRNLCAPAVHIDGVRVTRVGDRRSDSAMLESFEAVNMMHPSSIELIEIYRGPSELPGQFAGSTGMCGAIVVWTRRGAR